MATYAEGRDVMVGQLQEESTKLRTDTEFEFNKLKGEIEKWFELAKAHIDGQGTSGGFGKGGPHGGHTGVDKKEIAVWKLPEEFDKASFRHWVDAVDLQLEMVVPWRCSCGGGGGGGGGSGGGGGGRSGGSAASVFVLARAIACLSARSREERASVAV